MKNCFSLLLIAAVSCLPGAAKEYSVSSPDGAITVTVDDADGLKFSLERAGHRLLSPSALGLNLRDVPAATKVKKAKFARNVSQHIDAPFYRQSEFTETYNEMTLTLDNRTAVEVRAFDSGAAYRFRTMLPGEIVVDSETAEYVVPEDAETWLPFSTNNDKPMAMAYQNIYAQAPLSAASGKLAFLPLTLGYADGLKLTLTESDLEAYPGMFVRADSAALTLRAEFAPYPKTLDLYSWRYQLYVSSTEDYIARTAGTRTFPWRVFAVTTDDTQMPVNNLVYALASPSRIGDASWVKGGKVAWDWWNDWGLKGVPFEAGINMDTYKYYIDFAAENGIEYVVLDEGWFESKKGDMLTVVPQLDLEELVRYGADRNVGIILWTIFNVLNDQLEEACSRYAAMGIKGFKVDFLDRDDQTATEMVYRIAEAAARHHLTLDFHGFYKPTGLNRTFPNIINFEGVFGMEEVKWTSPDSNMPLYDVTFPYIRMLAGPVDYTPGAMRNATKKDWRAVYYNPSSMGTRCHQLATYIVYDSPFTMLCDAPTNYRGEEECLSFIVGVPTDVDQTVVPQGRMGEYIVSARRSGNDWWVGGLTNWDAREISLSLAFLPEGEYQAWLFVDGPNANKQAEDYTARTITVDNRSTIDIAMASGGGFAMRLTRK